MHSIWGIQSHCHGWLHCVRVHRGIQSHCHSWLYYVWVHRDIQSHHHSWLHCVWVYRDIQSHHHGWLLVYAGGGPGQGIIRSFIEGWSRSTSLQKAQMVAYCSEENGKGQQVLFQSALVSLTVHGEASAMWVSSTVCRVLQLAEVLQVQTHGAGLHNLGARWVCGVAGTTFVVMYLLGLTASRCSCMWLQAHRHCPLPMTWTMYNPWSAAWMTVAGSHRHLASLRTDTDCLANSEDFCQQPWQSWFAALREACWSRQSWSAVACGSVWWICCGTLVCKACW